MNKANLIGRIANEIDLKFLPGSGAAIASFSLAVDRKIKKEGQPSADFIPVVVWGKQAENTANYMGKGKLIAVSGRLQVRSYDAKDGTKRYVTEVVAEEVQFLDKGNKQDDFKPSNDFGNDDMTECTDDDIPF